MQSRFKRAGRASWLMVAGIAGIVAILVLFFVAGESAESAAVRFMDALAKGDVKTLVAMSDSPDTEPAELEKQWEYTAKVAGPHYMFFYKINSSLNPTENTAMVRMMVSRNVNREGSYEEKFELPMIKRDGKWKVEVRGLDRRLYPNLPRL